MGRDLTSLREQIHDETARLLAPRTAALVAVLRRLIAHPYPTGVALVEFQVFAEDAGMTRGWPVRAFFLDEHDTEHFVHEGDKAQYPCCVDPGLLDDEPVVPEPIHESWRRLAPDPDADVDTMAAEAVVPWFYACWIEAGGCDFPLPAFIGLHDDAFVFDLKRGVWLDPRTGERAEGLWPPRPS